VSRPLECTDCGGDVCERDAGDPVLHALYATPVCYGCHAARCAAADARLERHAARAFGGARMAS